MFSGCVTGDVMADFSHWDCVDTFGHIEAEALIAGVDPTAVGEGDSWRKTYPIHLRVVQGFSLATENYSGDQPPEALLCTSMQGGAISGNPPTDIALARFHRDEMARWLLVVGISPAYQFRKLPDPAPQATDSAATPVGRWPWGSHHTEALGHLEAAALRFWGADYYDPADKGTAPLNEDVSGWLQKERGVSKTLATAMASMLRLDGLPTGPRK